MVQMFDLPAKGGVASALGSALGQGLSQGSAYGLQKNFEQMHESQRAAAETSALQQAIAGVPANDYSSLQRAILTAPGVGNEFKKLALSHLHDQQSQQDTRNYRDQQLDIAKQRNALAAAKPAPTNKFSPLPPEQQEIVNSFLSDPITKKLDDVDFYAEGVRRNIPPAEMERLTKTRNEQKKTKNELSKTERQEAIKFHEESKEDDKQIRESAKRSKNQIEVIKDAVESIQSGNIKPSSIANVFKGFGEVGDKISKAFLNKDQAKLESLIPQLLEGWKEVFGVRLSDADLKLLQDKLPSIGKDPQANMSVLNVIEKYAKPAILREEIAREIKEKNSGLRPLGFADLVEKEFEKRSQSSNKIKVRNKQTGQTGMISPKAGWEELYEPI